MANTSIQENERVILKRRKHVLILIGHLLGPILFGAVPIVAYGIIAGRTFTIAERTLTIELPLSVVLLFASAWLLFFWMRTIGVWTDYYLDLWIVTDRHIIDREQRGFFSRETSVWRLDKIQDVTIETHGVLPTLFHFGDLHVQTAGESREFIMHGISNPKYVRQVILAAHDRLIGSEQRAPTPHYDTMSDAQE
jgi:uncharacterized membrane protein YdbT with pleckstrin-like domain